MSEFYDQDLTEQFNTVLSEKDEKLFQSWAYGNGRIGDLYDYDLRGAWKEIVSGSMSEDERGHLGDKYKKPNHPTFSTESVYANARPDRAGTWSRTAKGINVFTKPDGSSMNEDRYLKKYFQLREPNSILETESNE